MVCGEFMEKWQSDHFWKIPAPTLRRRSTPRRGMPYLDVAEKEVLISPGSAKA